MPRHRIGNSPFPLKRLDKDELVTLRDLEQTLAPQGMATISLRSSLGPPDRGGYFFNLRKEGDLFHIFDFEGNEVGTLTSVQIVRFVNHVSGRLFDQEMFTYCQAVVNLRQDEIGPEPDA